jgi:hypothetical protein
MHLLFGAKRVNAEKQTASNHKSKNERILAAADGWDDRKNVSIGKFSFDAFR